jgi:Putative methyltransferase
VKDWQQWHQAYDDPTSALARRLEVVRRRIGEVLSVPRETPIRVLSLCAGDGRDLLPVLAGTAVAAESIVLVETDAGLADNARRTAAALKLDTVAVITADAGDHEQFARAYPVDLLLLCGIFGNVPEGDIQTTVAATPTMLRNGGTVIWTRGSTQPDVRPAIRQWFKAAGLDEVAFDSEPSDFGVGVGVKPTGAKTSGPMPERLFRFIQ